MTRWALVNDDSVVPPDPYEYHTVCPIFAQAIQVAHATTCSPRQTADPPGECPLDLANPRTDLEKALKNAAVAQATMHLLSDHLGSNQAEIMPSCGKCELADILHDAVPFELPPGPCYPGELNPPSDFPPDPCSQTRADVTYVPPPPLSLLCKQDSCVLVKRSHAPHAHSLFIAAITML
jgi:hypothetical protein